MQEFINLVSQYYPAVLTAIFIAEQVLSVVKTFNTRKLRTAFDQLKRDSDLKTISVDNLTSMVTTLIYDLKIEERAKVILTEKIKLLESKIDEFGNSEVIVKLQESLDDLKELRQTLDLKDQTIEKYANDLREVKILLQKKGE